MSLQLGLIGLGLVGSSLVDRLSAAGFTLTGTDINASKRDAAAARGLAPVSTPAEVSRAARRIVLSLPDSDVVEHVVEGPSGLTGSLLPGDLIVDTTTSDPERTTALAARLAERGVSLLDATLLGSSVVIADGQSLAMVGGENESFDEARDILDAITHRAYYMGESGSGAQSKLIVNLVLGLNRLVLAEGLMLGRKSGIDLRVLLEVLKNGAAYSQVMDAKGEKMIEEDFVPQARLHQHLKDVGLILDLGMRLGLKLPASSLHADILREGVETGLGDLDNSAVIKALEHYVSK